MHANTFISPRCIFSKTDNDFNILVLLLFRPVRTYRTSIFECLIVKRNAR